MPANVTVIIVNYNGGAMVLECLAALRLQTFRHFVTVVVDNKSTDGSAQRIASDFPEVILHSMASNMGFAAANNFALKEVDLGEWVVFLNPDAYPRAGWLAKLLEATIRYPEFASYGSQMCKDSGGFILDGIGDSYHISGLIWREGHGALVSSKHTGFREIFSACAAAAMYRTEILLKLGGFDADLFCYVEDVDLGFRLRLAGHRSIYVPDAIVHHVGSGVVGVHSDFQIYHGHRNLVWVYIRNMPGPLFWIFLPSHIALNIFTLFWFALRGHGSVMWRAKRDAVRGIPKAWAKRKEAHSDRKASVWSILMQLTWNPFAR